MDTCMRDVEDIDRPDKQVLNKIKATQYAIAEVWEKTKKPVWTVFCCVSSVAYSVYFTYAIYHSFGYEGSMEYVLQYFI